jgi:hypothetical protein
MAEVPKDLEERTAVFAENVRSFVRRLPRTLAIIEDVKQLVRTSGSVPANCIEANQETGASPMFLLIDFLWPLAVWRLEFPQ